MASFSIFLIQPVDHFWGNFVFSRFVDFDNYCPGVVFVNHVGFRLPFAFGFARCVLGFGFTFLLFRFLRSRSLFWIFYRVSRLRLSFVRFVVGLVRFRTLFSGLLIRSRFLFSLLLFFLDSPFIRALWFYFGTLSLGVRFYRTLRISCSLLCTQVCV